LLFFVDLVAGGSTPGTAANARDMLGPLADVGATWWDEHFHLGRLDRFDDVRARIEQGTRTLNRGLASSPTESRSQDVQDQAVTTSLADSPGQAHLHRRLGGLDCPSINLYSDLESATARSVASRRAR